MIIIITNLLLLLLQKFSRTLHNIMDFERTQYRYETLICWWNWLEQESNITEASIKLHALLSPHWTHAFVFFLFFLPISYPPLRSMRASKHWEEFVFRRSIIMFLRLKQHSLMKIIHPILNFNYIYDYVNSMFINAINY